ncbi:hypothetical protein ACS5NO_20705 [Larkinella sp. GY13]|uniref:hypothetical protein n=1 Tax=Larkinella sp. GY13 TaxID=3453720 RepID=UPI003EF056CF
MPLNIQQIKDQITDTFSGSPPKPFRFLSPLVVRDFLISLIDWVTGQDYTPDHEWNGTQLRFKKADGVNGAYTDLKGAKGDKGDQGNPGTLTASVLPQSDGFDTDLLVAQTASGQLIKTQALRVLGVVPSATLEQPFSPTRLRIGLGSELVSLFFGGKLSNMMAFGIARGLFSSPAVALTGTATIANVTALTDDGDNIDAIFSGGVSGGTVQMTYAFTTPLLVYSQATFRFFSVSRFPYTTEVSNLKVEWQTSASGYPFRTVYDGVHVLKQGLFEIPATTEPDFPLRGLRVTYTIAANMTVRLMELGIAHARLPFGRGTLAELHQPNLFSKANIFSGGTTFNGDVTLKRLIASGNAPSVAVNAVNATGAGVGATASLVAGSTDLAGTLTLTTGTTPGTNVVLATVTLASVLSAAPKAVLLTARNNQTGMSFNRFFVGTKSSSGFTINATDSGPAGSTTFQFDYILIA